MLHVYRYIGAIIDSTLLSMVRAIMGEICTSVLFHFARQTLTFPAPMRNLYSRPVQYYMCMYSIRVYPVNDPWTTIYVGNKTIADCTLMDGNKSDLNS